jgi:hypothetical protein
VDHPRQGGGHRESGRGGVLLSLVKICFLETLVEHPERGRCGEEPGLLEEIKRVAKEELGG